MVIKDMFTWKYKHNNIKHSHMPFSREPIIRDSLMQINTLVCPQLGFVHLQS